MPFDAELPTPAALNKMTTEVFNNYLAANLKQVGFFKNLVMEIEPPHPAPPFPPHIPHDLYLLKKARARIAHGWTQKMMHNARTDGVCAVGALLCAVQGSMVPYQPRESDEPVVERLASIVYGSAGGLMGFNDTNGMTKGQVLELFDRAIARLEARVQAEMRFDRYRYDPNYSRQQYLDSVAMV